MATIRDLLKGALAPAKKVVMGMANDPMYTPKQFANLGNKMGGLIQNTYANLGSDPHYVPKTVGSLVSKVGQNMTPRTPQNNFDRVTSALNPLKLPQTLAGGMVKSYGDTLQRLDRYTPQNIGSMVKSTPSVRKDPLGFVSSPLIEDVGNFADMMPAGMAIGAVADVGMKGFKYADELANLRHLKEIGKISKKASGRLADLEMLAQKVRINQLDPTQLKKEMVINNPPGYIPTYQESIEKLHKMLRHPEWASGGIAGVEPQFDEEGKVTDVKYNPVNGALGVAGMAGGTKIAGKLDDMNIGKQQAKKELEGLMNYPNKMKEMGYTTDAIKKTSYTGFKKLGDVKPKQTLEEFVSKQADLKNKVGVLDYLRTPDRVLKKIGLKNESDLVRKAHSNYVEELPKEIDRITQWAKQVPGPESSTRIFKFLDGQKGVTLDSTEAKVAGEIKGYLKTWAERLGLPQDKRITNYITHIFDDQFIKKEFDDDLAKLLQDKVAGSVYDPFTQQRLGVQGYKEDVWQALDAYVKRGVRKANMDPALEKLKDSAEHLELSQYNYVRKYADRINMRPQEIDNLLDNSIKQIFGYKFTARPTAYLSKKLRQTGYRGTLGLNVGSALRNLTQGVNTYAKLGEKYTAIGYTKLATNGTDELKRVGVLSDSFIEDRALNATKKFWEKTDKGLFYLFELAEKINRGSAYYGAKAKALKKGMSEEQAIEFAKDLVRDTQFTFSKVDTPLGMQGDLVKVATQFQSYNVKQMEFLGEMLANKDMVGIARYAIGTFVVFNTIGKVLGMKPLDMLPSISVGTPLSVEVPMKAGQALIGGKDSYGNELTPEGRVKKAGEAVIPFIPGGVQMKKTIGGIKDVSRGTSESASGRVRFPIEQTPSNAIRAGLFGTNKLPEAQAYFNAKQSTLGDQQSQVLKSLEKKDQKKLYDYIQAKRDAGETVSLKNEPTPPKLTGQAEIDKKLLSGYKSDLTARQKTIMAFYEAGIMTAEQAEKEIQLLKAKQTWITNATKKGSSKKPPTMKVPNFSSITKSNLSTPASKIGTKTKALKTSDVLAEFNKVQAKKPVIKAPSYKKRSKS